MKTQKQMNSIVKVIVELLLDIEGMREFRILNFPEDNEIIIDPMLDEIDWNLLESIQKITDKVPCTWSIRMHEDSLVIVLKND